MDVRIRMQNLEARKSEVAQDGLERYINEEEARIDKKTKLNRLLDAATQYESSGEIDSTEESKLSTLAFAAGVDGPNMHGTIRSDDAGDSSVNARKDQWDAWKKTVTRNIEALDDGQAVQQIKMQQLNNQMLNSDGARTDQEKQTHDLDKKIRDNAFSASV